MRYRFKTSQWVPYSTELVFAFFADPNNLPLISIPWQRVRIEEAMLAPPPPRPALNATGGRLRGIAAGKGSQIALTFRPFPLSPLRVGWRSEITHFDWNVSFVDAAIQSPFPYWEHHHNFSAETRANTSGVTVTGTLIKDELSYVPPGTADTWSSRKFHDHVVLPLLKRMFKARYKRLLQVLPVVLARMVPPTQTPVAPRNELPDA
jgi:ligand-binding SRPBCC domain-containing protein